jgi:heme-degrading monooxygenase HmoA
VGGTPQTRWPRLCFLLSRKPRRNPASDAIARQGLMFIAMNRFKVKKGAEADFEAVWLNREIHLDQVPGFVEFHLLRGPEREDHVLYSSHTVWASEQHFVDWTRSEAFRAAHRDAGGNRPLYLGHPEFEGFAVLQTVKPAAARRAT